MSNDDIHNITENHEQHQEDLINPQNPANTSDVLSIQKRIEEYERLLEDVINNLGIFYFAYYPATGHCDKMFSPDTMWSFTPTIENYPESFIKSSMMSNTDAQKYREMVQRVIDGAPESGCIVSIINNGKSVWLRVRLFNQEGKKNPEKILGFAANADDYMLSQQRLSDNELSILTMQQNSLRANSINLTKDTLNLYRNDLLWPDSDGKSVNYLNQYIDEASEAVPDIRDQSVETLSILIYGAPQIPEVAHRKQLYRLFNRKALLKAYESGKTHVSFDYRRNIGDDIRWVRLTVTLLENPENGDILAFFNLQDINSRVVQRTINRKIQENNCDYIALIHPADGTITYTMISHKNMALFKKTGIHVGVPMPYKETMLNYEESWMDEGHRVHLVNNISIENLTKKLHHRNSYTYTYDMYFKEEYRRIGMPDHMRNQITFSWLDKYRDNIVAVQIDVTSSYEKDLEQMRLLNEVAAKANAANDAKTEFISRISHDIRTPIGAILNLTDFAHEDIENPEKLKEDLARIGTSGRFLLSLINDVLDITHIDSGKIELHPEPYPFSDYISEIRNILEPMCDDKGLTYDYEINVPSNICVNIDKTRINQVILNLISNAVKYTPTGGHVRFGASAVPKGDNIFNFIVYIEDNGIGMSEDFAAHAFESFAQDYDNPYRDNSIPGTGLGLPIVKKLYDLMGGEIKLESKLGEGTRVSLYIDLEDISSKDIIRTPSVLNTAVKGNYSGNILIAEDNEINSQIAQRIFENLGFDVTLAENGERACQIFSDSEPGYFKSIFMDIQMPVMNGYDAAKKIRKLKRTDSLSIPIIAMTADAYTTAMKKAREAGMNGFTTKPLKITEICEIIESNRID